MHFGSFGPRPRALLLATGLALVATASDARPGPAVWLDTLDLSGIEQGWGEPHANASVEGHPLRIAGKTYERGIGTHASSDFLIDLDGGAERFEALVGIDDEVGGNAAASVAFQVLVDGKRVWESGVVRAGQEPRAASVPLEGAKHLRLVVTDAGDGIHYDHADWADGRVLLKDESAPRPRAVVIPGAPGTVRTPAAPSAPRINGPRRIGARPGAPFLERVAASGAPPLHFAATGLPTGLALDETTGVISGALREHGTTPVQVVATNAHGEASATLEIVAGDAICLAPTLGWSSWYCWGTSVDDSKVRAAADALVKSGLAAHGWTYINIDDGWEGSRAKNGTILPSAKFPDMKALADHVHALGLKLGIYSSPGPRTCAGYEGTFGHEAEDVATYAAWGIDFLKYDWCSCRSSDPQQPYRKIAPLLASCGRDIVLNLCQYGAAEVWRWGASAGGNSWRTTGDITDTWWSVSRIGFGQAGLEEFSGPGHWNDPDNLQVGRIGMGPHLRPTRLKPDEQYTQVTLWCLLAAPLVVGCDLDNLDEFTRGLLTNDEVLAVDEDPLGKQASRVEQVDRTEVWARPLADGTTAVGLFNRDLEPHVVKVAFASLKREGTQPIRDLWRQKDLGEADGAFATEVPAHGAVLLRVGRPSAESHGRTR
jgi:alpha-galactosidase